MFSVIYSLTITQPAHHDMRTRCVGDRPEMFPLGEGYGILGVPRDGGRSDEDGHRQTGAMNPARLLAVFAAIGLWAYSASAADLRPEDAASHIGETATVCGVVASAKFEAHARAQPTLLDLGKSYPHAIFTAVIYGDHRPKFDTPETSLRGKRGKSANTPDDSP